jgi:hypothetical protein
VYPYKSNERHHFKKILVKILDKDLNPNPKPNPNPKKIVDPNPKK